VVEYAGPLVIYLFFYFLLPYVYADSKPRSLAQNLAAICWVGHYLKREFETLFVHRFSNETMPIFNIFKNSGYYWGAAALVSYFVNHPLYTDPPLPQVYVAFVLFVIMEISNAYCHIILRNLRPPGTRERRIPRGFLFEYISCPNYTCEILAWLAFAIMTQTLTAFGFMLLGVVQMWAWAWNKHQRYLKEFENYPKNRWIMLPLIY